MIKIDRIIQENKITGVTSDSRKVKKGNLYVAIKGEHVDGNDYIGEAISRGAKVVLSEKCIDTSNNILCYQVDDTRKWLSIAAAEFYGNPAKKLKVIGVTGSDGKTTTSHLIYEILKNAGKKVGLVSTVTAKIGNRNYDTGFHVTNPEPVDLQRYLSMMVKKGMEFAIIETTSHGIAQSRVYGIDYYATILTNITHEHIDYHKTFENYRDTKLKIFMNSKLSVLNKDDKSYRYFNEKIKGKKITYSMKDRDSDYFIDRLSIRNHKMYFSLVERKITKNITAKLLGEYNAMNIASAIAVARSLKIKWEDIIKAIGEAKAPKGRLEEIPNKKNIHIYIDFAHTPNSLKQVLTLLSEISRKKLIVVFGCAGERDIQKRQMMAKIATSIADVCVFTAEDPRHEDVNDILKEMQKGAIKKSVYKNIPERGAAITYAINKVANNLDTVVICGKAHEKSMAYGDIEYPWSDFDAVKLALRGEELKISRK